MKSLCSLLYSAAILAFLIAPAQAALPLREKLALRDEINRLGMATEAARRTKPASAEAEKLNGNVAELKNKVVFNAKDDLEQTVLRENGFAINMGYGYFSDLKDYAKDVQVRYNFLQKQRVMAEVNHRLEKFNLDKSDQPSARWLTDLSAWIGYPLEELGNRERDVGKGVIAAAGSVKESPVLVGVGFGFGRGAEFSSAFSINAGVALFKNPAFKQNQFYVGVSVDAVLFKSIVQALAGQTEK